MRINSALTLWALRRVNVLFEGDAAVHVDSRPRAAGSIVTNPEAHAQDEEEDQ
ncbi:hypothetical protein ACRAWF_33320 [Streptomyces sp. L7]